MSEWGWTTLARHHAPNTPQASFKSSDQGLDAVWDLSARWALYTTHEQFVDTSDPGEGHNSCGDTCDESQVIMRVHGRKARPSPSRRSGISLDRRSGSGPTGG